MSIDDILLNVPSGQRCNEKRLGRRHNDAQRKWTPL